VNKDMEALRQTLESHGWRTVVTPTLQRTLLADMDSLASVKRPPEQSDDYLRGRISAIRDFIIGFQKRLDEYDFEQKKMKDSESQAAKSEKGVGSPYDEE